jgi:hypothetical protein
MQRGRLFTASCVSLVTTSMVFAIRGDIEGAMSSAFQIFGVLYAWFKARGGYRAVELAKSSTASA